jgi:hypothetical protein
MLDDFHRQHDVETLVRIEFFHGGAAIVDRQLALLGMQIGRGNIGRRRIDTGHLCTKPRERFAQQARTTADIEQAQAIEAIQAARIAIELPAGGVADEGQPQRIDLVQRRHFAARIPPLLGEF